MFRRLPECLRPNTKFLRVPRRLGARLLLSPSFRCTLKLINIIISSHGTPESVGETQPNGYITDLFEEGEKARRVFHRGFASVEHSQSDFKWAEAVLGCQAAQGATGPCTQQQQLNPQLTSAQQGKSTFVTSGHMPEQNL